MTIRKPLRKTAFHAALAAAGLAVSANAMAGAFLFAGSEQSDGSTLPFDIITHPPAYFGSGGDVNVSVCINPSSEAIDEMQVSLANAIDTWNRREPASPNLFFGSSNDIPSGAVDFESTLLHELGHCLGLAHPNEATESGLSPTNRDYTRTNPGPNRQRDLDPGADGIRGSADDLRGDDINLHWFAIDTNNPFVLSTPIDISNYSRDLADLPGGDTFAANADRSVGAALGFAQTEAVMQQGAFGDEDQRQLAVDDVVTLGLGMAGLDRTAGTADDYRPVLVYGGVQEDCDINIDVSGSSFAFCQAGGQFINQSGSPPHIRISSADVQLGSTSQINWFFSVSEDLFADGFETPPSE